MNNDRIPCFILVYWLYEHFKICVEQLISSNLFDIYIIENPSPATPKLKDYILRDLRGYFRRYYLFDENITNNAVKIILNLEEAVIRSSTYTMYTDGDLSVDSLDFFQEQIDILNTYREVAVCGANLNWNNHYTPSRRSTIITKDSKDYIEHPCGAQYLLFRQRGLLEVLSAINKDNKMGFKDTQARQTIISSGQKWVITSQNRANHLTWTTYQDKKHPYTKAKLAKGERGIYNLWRHSRVSGYSIFEGEE